MDNVIGYTTASPELCLHIRVKLNVDRLLSFVNNNIIPFVNTIKHMYIHVPLQPYKSKAPPWWLSYVDMKY